MEIAKRPNTLLFIGNGFDIACGYATKYSEFVEDETFKNLIQNNNLCIHINNVNTIQQWVDLETELYNYSLKIVEEGGITEESSKQFKQEFFDLSFALQNYIASINSTKNIGISSNAGKTMIQKWNNENNIISTICFNYSKFFYLQSQEELLKENRELRKVHGNISPGEFNQENTIVLGIDDSMKVNPAHSFLYKSSNDVLEIMGVVELIKSSEKYIVFGCSLGCTDEWYFKKIFTQKGEIFEIYYHGEEEKYEILHRIRLLSGGNLSDFKDSNTLILVDCSDNSKFINSLKKKDRKPTYM